MATEPLTRETATAWFARLFRGEHHIPGKVREDGNGIWSTLLLHGAATFDFDELTRIVIAAHDDCVRAWLTPGPPGAMRLWIQRRDRASSDLSRGHPTIELAIEKYRAGDHEPWWRWLHPTSLGCWKMGPATVVARTEGDAWAVYTASTGETREDHAGETFVRIADDHPITIVDDDAVPQSECPVGCGTWALTDVADAHDGFTGHHRKCPAVRTTKTAHEWAMAEGRGVLCSTEV